MMGNQFCKAFGNILMDWLHLCKLENKWLMSRVVQVCTQIWIFVRKAPFICMWIVKGCVGCRTNSRVRLEETPGGLGSGSTPRHRMMAQLALRLAGALVRHQLPMINGELPEMSLLRCPSEWLLKLYTNTMEIIPRNNSVLLSSGGGSSDSLLALFPVEHSASATGEVW